MRPATPALEMSDVQRETLTALSRSRTAPVREVQRAAALLLDADGLANYRIGGEVRKGRGPKPTIPQEKIDEIVGLTKNSTPDGETHWSCRSMAEKVGVSKDTVQRAWSARGLKPHL